MFSYTRGLQASFRFRVLLLLLRQLDLGFNFGSHMLLRLLRSRSEESFHLWYEFLEV